MVDKGLRRLSIDQLNEDEQAAKDTMDNRKGGKKSDDTPGNTISNITSNTNERPNINQTDNSTVILNSREDALAVSNLNDFFEPPKLKPRYVPVTFKVLETEQIWIDKHVRDTGRMKQDVLGKAIQLYRELYEAHQRGEKP